MAVYLIHSSVRIGRPGKNGAQHYLGMTHDEDVERRLHEHKTRKNAPAIIRAFREAGGVLQLAYVWKFGGAALERYLKDNGHLERYCRFCRDDKKVRAIEWPQGARSRSDREEKRLLRLTQMAVGEPSPGTPTPNSGSAHQLPIPELSTSSPGGPAPVTTTPGTTSGDAVAPPRPKGDSPAGTRQPWFVGSNAGAQRRSVPGRNGLLRSWTP